MKGTPSMGKKSGKKNMIFCRRCGQRTLTLRGRTCASCGFGSSKKMRSYAWQKVRKKSVLHTNKRSGPKVQRKVHK